MFTDFPVPASTLGVSTRFWKTCVDSDCDGLSTLATSVSGNSLKVVVLVSTSHVPSSVSLADMDFSTLGPTVPCSTLGLDATFSVDEWTWVTAVAWHASPISPTGSFEKVTVVLFQSPPGVISDWRSSPTWRLPPSSARAALRSTVVSLTPRSVLRHDLVEPATGSSTVSVSVTSNEPSSVILEVRSYRLPSPASL